MLLFSRRTLQKYINGVAGIMPAAKIQQHVRDIDTSGKNGLPAVWELTLTYAHSKVTETIYEPDLHGSHPDLHFPEIRAWIDIKTTSDDETRRVVGIDYFEEQFRKLAVKYFGSLNGVDFQIGPPRRGSEGETIAARLSLDKPKLHSVLKRQVKDLRERVDAAGGNASKVRFEIDGVSFELGFTPNRPTFGGGHPVYTDQGEAKDQPAVQRLGEARKQLGRREVGKIKGIYLCDGGCSAWKVYSGGGSSSRIIQIVQTYLRTTRSIDFVVSFAARPGQTGKEPRCLEAIVHAPDPTIRADIEALTRSALFHLDPPKQDSASAGCAKYGNSRNSGFYGGFTIKRGNPMKIRMSARQVLGILSGHLPADSLDGTDFNGKPEAGLHSELRRLVTEGRLICGVELIKTPNDDDDWIEMTFSMPDPAVSPLKVSSEK